MTGPRIPLRRPRWWGRQLREVNPVPVGAVFLLVIAALLAVALNVNRLPFWSGRTYSAAFAEAAGLRAGDAVRVAGVQVGRVDSVSLQGTHVEVSFTLTDGSVHLGDLTTASIQIFTLLGNKYLSLSPAGAGSWPTGREIPLDRTSSPYDVTTAFEDLTTTVRQVDTQQLAASFRTLADTFRGTPPAVQSLLTGLSRLAQTVTSRDQELGSLLRHAAGVTGVLADRRQQVGQLLTAGSQLLQMLEARRAIVAALLTNTTRVSEQLVGLIQDNQTTIAPLLAQLHGIVGTLRNGEYNLDEVIKRLFVFTRNDVATIGSGPWFDGIMINALNPFKLPPGSSIPTFTRTPRTFGQLLRIPMESGG